MSATATKTTDHEEIRAWVEKRGGHPAAAPGTGGKDDAGVLRIDFPGVGDEDLEQLEWDAFFQKFEEAQLAFLYQDKTADGKLSRFNRFVKRDDD
ncbi:MAG TPA: hypothetical protein VK035_01135 [Kiloniellales bacterium]|nr:hypothetical protein [Kiloniellales bacterium]